MNVVLGAFSVGLVGCATAPPQNPNDICSIYREKRSWYFAAMKAQEKWHVPNTVPMAMMYQESGFHSDIQTRRTYILWIIPWGHITSAYGYAQAENGVWHDYQRSIGHDGDRTNYADALDFMDWYMTRTHRLAGVPLADARNQYLAYHEGWGGYRRGTYQGKPWLGRVASKVGSRAQRYKTQYDRCADSLKPSFWEWLFSWLP
ncbi:hypothetical protein E3E12_04575 [Formicincola oecophyllae]|uniref:Transglycosylase SLT domain-containing protein n=1 Tax=Formicincola oecophyllae TaxID=2558361 RepID=A0A4Y6UA93_9PROT|nr:hypothetical protein E3E12_04575 [Formicincola oecophyllae]